MPSGLQIWAPDGRIRVDTSTITALIVGEITVGGAGTAQTGSIYDARLTLGTPFFFITQQGIFDPSGTAPIFSVSNGTLSWQFPFAGSESHRRPITSVVYGIQ